MIELTFPDNSVREYAAGTTGLAVAEGISKSLAKKAVAMALDGELKDLTDPISGNHQIEIVTRDDPRALELIRHDAAHVMAEAVQELWPGTQVTIGPVIENGFYYDFKRVHPDTGADWPFTPEELPFIEKKMREIIGRGAQFTKEVWSRDEAKRYFAAKGEDYKVELVDAIPEDQELKIYKQGQWLDLCRGPHMVSTRQIGDAFKLMKVAGAYWRGDSNNEMLTRIYGNGLAQTRRSSKPTFTCWKRPKSATTASWAGKWTCSISRKKARCCLLAPEGLGHVPEPDRLHAPGSEGHLQGGERTAGAAHVAVGNLRSLGPGTRRTCSPCSVPIRKPRTTACLRAEADELSRSRADLQARAEELPRSAYAPGRVRQWCTATNRLVHCTV